MTSSFFFGGTRALLGNCTTGTVSSPVAGATGEDSRFLHGRGRKNRGKNGLLGNANGLLYGPGNLEINSDTVVFQCFFVSDV